MMNPLQFVQAMRNPQEFMQKMMENSQVMQNPIMRNTMEMMQKKDYEGVEKLAKNLCKEKGMDYEQLCKEIKATYKGRYISSQ